MPLLFVLAGISAKYSLQKRTRKEYLVERIKRLLVPFLFGTIAFMPVMSYIGDRFNYSYNEGYLKHYAIFFTKYTDLTGADGGFSVGQFWFLYGIFGNKTCVLFIGTVLLSYLTTFVCCEISIRIPVLCFLTGTKYNLNK